MFVLKHRRVYLKSRSFIEFLNICESIGEAIADTTIERLNHLGLDVNNMRMTMDQNSFVIWIHLHLRGQNYSIVNGSLLSMCMKFERHMECNEQSHVEGKELFSELSKNVGKMVIKTEISYLMIFWIWSGENALKTFFPIQWLLTEFYQRSQWRAIISNTNYLRYTIGH